MGKVEYIVMGSWAIHGRSGKIRHTPCRRWCNYYNEDGEPNHSCDANEDEGYDVIAIPQMVVTVSECLRKKNEHSST